MLTISSSVSSISASGAITFAAPRSWSNHYTLDRIRNKPYFEGKTLFCPKKLNSIQCRRCRRCRPIPMVEFDSKPHLARLLLMLRRCVTFISIMFCISSSFSSWIDLQELHRLWHWDLFANHRARAYRHCLLHDKRLLSRGHPLRVHVLLLEPNLGVYLSLQNQHHHGPLNNSCNYHYQKLGKSNFFNLCSSFVVG